VSVTKFTGVIVYPLAPEVLDYEPLQTACDIW